MPFPGTNPPGILREKQRKCWKSVRAGSRFGFCIQALHAIRLFALARKRVNERSVRGRATRVCVGPKLLRPKHRQFVGNDCLKKRQKSDLLGADLKTIDYYGQSHVKLRAITQ